jgi:CRISPR-associated protein Cmr4
MRQHPVPKGEAENFWLDETNYWFGQEASSGDTTEARVKFEYASLLWLPVFCPGQPIVWVTCPRLLKRYQRFVEKLKDKQVPDPYTGSESLRALNIDRVEKLFFNFGFLTIKEKDDLTAWFPNGEELPAVVVADDEIGMIHDMALYRQTRTALAEGQKRVENFFGVEALPEGTILTFPIAIRPTKDKTWNPFNGSLQSETYLGGLESIGFGHCQISLKGDI